MNSFSVCGIFLFIMLLAKNVYANTVEWSATAMTCTPSANTVAENNYITTAGVVKFKPDASGRIDFLCTLSRPLPAGMYFLSSSIEASSPNRPGLEIQLRQRNKSNGRIQNITTASAVLPSNDALKRFSSQFAVNIDFDFSVNAYWVQIIMKKQNAGSPMPPPVLNVELIRVDGGSANVTTVDKHKVTSFDTNDMQIVHVEVDDDAWVTFKGKKDGSGNSGINNQCLTCKISNISQCARSICPDTKAQNPNASCSDAISRCIQNACQADCGGGSASTSLSESYHGDLFDHVKNSF